METELVISVVVGCFIYNVIIKAIASIFVKSFFATKVGKDIEEKVHKSFEERLKEKQSQTQNAN